LSQAWRRPGKRGWRAWCEAGPAGWPGTVLGIDQPHAPTYPGSATQIASDNMGCLRWIHNVLQPQRAVPSPNLPPQAASLPHRPPTERSGQRQRPGGLPRRSRPRRNPEDGPFSRGSRFRVVGKPRPMCYKGALRNSTSLRPPSRLSCCQHRNWSHPDDATYPRRSAALTDRARKAARRGSPLRGTDLRPV
jgi:hypothetical protein